MTQYLLSVHGAADAPTPSGPEFTKMSEDVAAFNEHLVATGSWVFGGVLFPADTATVVKATDGDALVTDGPYLEAKEYLGGIWVVEAQDLDAGLDLARRASAAIGIPVEVRPFQAMPDA